MRQPIYAALTDSPSTTSVWTIFSSAKEDSETIWLTWLRQSPISRGKFIKTANQRSPAKAPR